jgi:hypothetical protein
VRHWADQILASYGAHDRVFCGSVAVEILPSFAAPRFLHT